MTNGEKWWQANWSEELTIVSLLSIALIAIFFLADTAKDVCLTIAGGLIGYLTRASKKEGNNGQS